VADQTPETPEALAELAFMTAWSSPCDLGKQYEFETRLRTRDAALIAQREAFARAEAREAALREAVAAIEKSRSAEPYGDVRKGYSRALGVVDALLDVAKRDVTSPPTPRVDTVTLLVGKQTGVVAAYAVEAEASAKAEEHNADPFLAPGEPDPDAPYKVATFRVRTEPECCEPIALALPTDLRETDVEKAAWRYLDELENHLEPGADPEKRKRELLDLLSERDIAREEFEQERDSAARDWAHVSNTIERMLPAPPSEETP
jgi:hypothetical protein